LYEPGNANSKTSQGTGAASRQPATTEAVAKPPVEKPREALQKVESPVKSVKSPPRHAPVVAGEYTIFTGTFRSKANADRELRRLTGAGLDASVREVRGMYSVSAGSYQSRSEAESFVARNKALFPNGHHIGKSK
jgi:cell division protein FtsN